MTRHHPKAVAHARYDSPLGPLMATATERGIAGLWFDDQKYHPGPADVPEAPRQRWLAALGTQLRDYFGGRLRRFTVPLDLHGTPFQQAVWRALLAIDAGDTRTYSQIAEQAGSPAAVRAAGGAIGHNPASIVVPCHRVIGRDGSLTGYAGGLPRKNALLRLEGAMTNPQESRMKTATHAGPALSTVAR
jgi:methylated-DNA-[protein]-cysteine S-methyltransferase